MQEKHLFARKCYTWRSRAKQPNGRRKMILSLFPGDPLSPGIMEMPLFFLMPRKFQSTTFTQMEILEQFDIFVSSLCAKLINACTDYLQMDLAFFIYRFKSFIVLNENWFVWFFIPNFNCIVSYVYLEIRDKLHNLFRCCTYAFGNKQIRTFNFATGYLI